MPGHAKIGLDNDVFRGRLRVAPKAAPAYTPRPILSPARERFFSEVLQNEAAAPAPVPAPHPPAESQPEPQAHMVNEQSLAASPPEISSSPPPKAAEINLTAAPTRRKNYLSVRAALLGMACLVFLIGVVLSMQTVRANNAAAAQIQGLYQQIDKENPGIINH